MENQENKEDKKIYKILLAEDDKFISNAFRDGLTHAGFDVVTAYDGEEALKKLKTYKPDIMLLDIIMPKMDGFQVLEEINRIELQETMDDSSFLSMPVIVFTNLSQSKDVERAKELGAVDFLVKANNSMSEVIEKVKEHLGIG